MSIKKSLMKLILLSSCASILVACGDDESTEKKQAKVAANDFENHIQANYDKLKMILHCKRVGGNSRQQLDEYWIGLNKTEKLNRGSEEAFVFPRYKMISPEDNKHEVELRKTPAFVFHYNGKGFVASMQYAANVDVTESSYTFSSMASVGEPNYQSGEHKLRRDTGILTTNFNGFRNNFQCSQVADEKTQEVAKVLYMNVHDYTFRKYDEMQRSFDQKKSSQKF